MIQGALRGAAAGATRATGGDAPKACTKPEELRSHLAHPPGRHSAGGLGELA